jgi:hypothetical protein
MLMICFTSTLFTFKRTKRHSTLIKIHMLFVLPCYILEAGGIDSLEMISGLLKSFKVPSLRSNGRLTSGN